MLESAKSVCRDDEAPVLPSTGAMVFSVSGRLLYIDRTAIDLLGTVDADWRGPTRAQPVPRCLMTIVQEIVTTRSTTDSGAQSSLAGASHILGERSPPIQAQVFFLPNHQHEGRIVFVLSPRDQGA